MTENPENDAAGASSAGDAPLPYGLGMRLPTLDKRGRGGTAGIEHHELSGSSSNEQKYDLHPLAVADMIHTPQRPKIEEFPANEEHHARLFMIARMIRLLNGHLSCEQVSMFLAGRLADARGDRPIAA